MLHQRMLFHFLYSVCNTLSFKIEGTGFVKKCNYLIQCGFRNATFFGQCIYNKGLPCTSKVIAYQNTFLINVKYMEIVILNYKNTNHKN